MWRLLLVVVAVVMLAGACSEELSVEVSRQIRLESRLRNALSGDEFVVHYQPVLAASTGKLVGAEALVRWEDPELGLLPPADFIGFAEKTGASVISVVSNST